jgi:tyrosinase
MFALWQVLHPDSYVEPQPAPQGGTFTRVGGDTEDVDSDLTPFWSDPSTFYSSATAKGTNSFGYAYPETQSWKFSDTASYQQSVRRAISKLYGATVPVSGVTRVAPVLGPKVAAGIKPSDKESNGKPVLSRSLEETDPVKASPGKNGVSKALEIAELDGVPAQKPSDGTHHPKPGTKYKEWIANIRVQKHTLGGPFQVHIFLGDVPVDTDSWLVHDDNVGTFSVLGSDPATTRCEKCKTDAANGLIVTGVIPLTEALLDSIAAGYISSLEPEQVVPYLAKMLHWRVTQVSYFFWWRI